ncbi:hypothetical protein HHL22_22925 [Hymenobacter sp. RP-2-7]|uniref:DUF5672 domain-containing protein n=1 Tax=Hymenobacter polaris TaxID=2682546 RepID=A0A7Y0AIQ2_9BACT|nr:DUF5672 family protein [Hymenobacter polaris]NML68062.1 hypothetical protein [Hymenobacter polaris]
MNLDAYRQVVPSFEVIYIDPKWQSNIAAYNKLKLSRYFYRLFSSYEYLLTYETDAFVFKDELAAWCEKGYDYIGAPWFEDYNLAGTDARLVGVGNSGFSLRKVAAVARVLKRIYYKNPFDYTSGLRNLIKAYANTPYRWLRNLSSENYTIQTACSLSEDRFYSDVAPLHSPSFAIAPIEEAVKFSFEVRPEVLYKLNGEQLPMGCHAWWRYSFEFWKPIIESYGYTL